MKLKYYLRGIGIGVIVATLIMTISSYVHNNNLSDEKIIKEALKLGMVMPEKTDDKDSLWEKNTQTNTEDDSEKQIDTSETETKNETETVDETELETETQLEEEPQEREYVSITVEDTDGARRVAIKLESVGVIDDATEFHSYLKKNGYAKVIRSGRFKIPVDATYEEICSIIIKKK